MTTLKQFSTILTTPQTTYSSFHKYSIQQLISFACDWKKYDMAIDLIKMHKMWKDKKVVILIIENSMVELFPFIFPSEKTAMEYNDGWILIGKENDTLNICKQLYEDISISFYCIVNSIKQGHFRFLDYVFNNIQTFEKYCESGFHTSSPFGTFTEADIPNLLTVIQKYNYKPDVYTLVEMWRYYGESKMINFLATFVSLKDIEEDYVDELEFDDEVVKLYNYIKKLRLYAITIQRWVRPIIWKPHGRLSIKLYYESEFPDITPPTSL